MFSNFIHLSFPEAKLHSLELLQPPWKQDSSASFHLRYRTVPFFDPIYHVTILLPFLCQYKLWNTDIKYLRVFLKTQNLNFKFVSKLFKRLSTFADPDKTNHEPNQVECIEGLKKLWRTYGTIKSYINHASIDGIREITDLGHIKVSFPIEPFISYQCWKGHENRTTSKNLGRRHV